MNRHRPVKDTAAYILQHLDSETISIDAKYAAVEWVTNAQRKIYINHYVLLDAIIWLLWRFIESEE